MSRSGPGTPERAPGWTESKRLRRPRGAFAGFLGVLAAALLAGGMWARADNLYISYANTADAIEEFTSSGGNIADDGLFTNSNVSTPNGIAFDGEGNLYVANYAAGTVSEFTAGGSYVGIYASGLSSPGGMAFDQAGNLYVANSGNGTVVEIMPSGATSIYASGLSGPNGLVFGPNGNLYIADGSNNSIVEITTNGPVIFASASQIPNGPAGVGFNALDDPEGLAFDSSGNLYVTNFEDNNIVEFAPDGTPTTFASNGSVQSEPTNPEGLWSPVGIAFDSSGDVFVANYSHTGMEGEGYSYIDEYSSTGTLLNAFTDASQNLRDASYIAIETNSGVPLLGVPEPSSEMLLMAGAASLVGVGWWRRRRG